MHPNSRGGRTIAFPIMAPTKALSGGEIQHDSLHTRGLMVVLYTQGMKRFSVHSTKYHQLILGLYWGNMRVVLGLYGDNGKENGNCYLRFRLSFEQM